MRPLTERQRNAKDAMRLLLGRPACDHSSAADAAFVDGAGASHVNLEEELAEAMDSGIVTPVDFPEVLESNTNWANTIDFASAAPDLEIAFETDEENTLICHQCGAEHIAPFDVAFPFLNGDATFFCRFVRARGCISHLRLRRAAWGGRP